MQQPNLRRVLFRCARSGLSFDMMDTSFFVGRVKIVPAGKSRLGRVRPLQLV
jgi:KUP system potassium uptake protein